jgi:hypothetical protein
MGCCSERQATNGGQEKTEPTPNQRIIEHEKIKNEMELKIRVLTSEIQKLQQSVDKIQEQIA